MAVPLACGVVSDTGKASGEPGVDKASVAIAAPPGAVWDLVADVTRMGEWSPECTSCRWLGRRPREPRVGATFVGFNRRGWARWATTNVVERSERGRVFAFRVRETGVRWAYLLESDGEGGTRLTETRDLSAARTWLIRATGVFVGGMDAHADELREGMRATLDRIKATAEAGAAPPAGSGGTG